MPSPFETWTLKQAQDAVADAYSQTATINRLFVEGDHWQSGNGWVGPRPDATDGAYYETMALISGVFVAENVIGEGVKRHAGGVIGREPAWSATLRRPLEDDEEPLPAEQALIDEAEALLTEWWDVRRIHKLFRETAITALWAERACIRLFVPREKVVDGRLPELPLPRSLSPVYLTAPPPDQVAVVTDEATQTQAGIFVYEECASPTVGYNREQRAEITYLDDNGNTVLRILGPGATGDGGPNVLDETVLSLGGQLTIFQLDRETFITEPIRSQQKLLNKAITMMSHNLDTAGFLERIFTNAELPFHYVSDADSIDGRKKVYEPLHVGAGTTNVLRGISTTDASGNQSVTTPGVHFRDPVPVSTFTESASATRQSILRQCHQLHVVLSGDAVASGESRRQALADYISDLLLTKPEVEAAGRWLLETALAMAATFAGVPNRYASLRAVFEARLDPGPIPAEEMRLVMELVDKKLLSRQTGMNRVGVDDVDAEQQEIMTERAASLSDKETRANIVKVLVEAGAGLESAAKTAGFDEEEVAVLVADAPEKPEPPPVVLPFGATGVVGANGVNGATEEET